MQGVAIHSEVLSDSGNTTILNCAGMYIKNNGSATVKYGFVDNGGVHILQAGQYREINFPSGFLYSGKLYLYFETSGTKEVAIDKYVQSNEETIL